MLSAGISRLPNEPSLYLDRGLLYAKLAEIGKAKADFKYAEQLDSSQSLSAYATDLAELESNHQDIALANLRAQLKVFPESPLLHYLFAKILDTVGSNDGGADVSAEALQSALAAARLKPDMVEAHDLLSAMYMRAGQYGKAIEECRLVLNTRPMIRALCITCSSRFAMMEPTNTTRRSLPLPRDSPMQRDPG